MVPTECGERVSPPVGLSLLIRNFGGGAVIQLGSARRTACATTRNQFRSINETDVPTMAHEIMDDRRRVKCFENFRLEEE